MAFFDNVRSHSQLEEGDKENAARLENVTMVVLAFDDVVDDTMMMIWRGRHVKVRDLNKVDNS